MGRSTVHYADSATNNLLKRLHNKLRPAGTPVQRVEYIIELLLLRIFEVKLKKDPDFLPLRKLFRDEKADLLFSALASTANDQILPALNGRLFPFYSRILSEARSVLAGNPNDRVKDQLVLIEEVFGNSNFSNNVTSGNMGEVIGLVGELDEERLLKTDLLGDAIESALSETGGTKDIGLHRTPDHIRQFMVGLVAPSFQDRIFDPTAGTGGFLFDGFEFVMQGVTRDGRWPGPKAHLELAAWFTEWFQAHRASMPSVEVSKDFYRQGVTGIEYLGMIRKMAAINFYIRGLNPGNILQGDSLALFKRQFHPESATAILANPPFGAERDQEAYPEVWAEYPRESETTILFVKLMLETLKPGGRCAVVVSEGFMTWDQNSARALRKALLDEADLKAIISLPQGVFVSKSGQGPKTSILYFEKPPKGAATRQVTRRVWFYKVTNDGYSMGTNRKEVPGCQFVEALDLFHRFVRRGEAPPESRHAFIVPAPWIRTLDPRVRERIRNETRAEITAKAEEDRAKLFATLETRVAAGKLTEAEMEERLSQHETLWENKLANETARRIDRAHLYSFNLANYRSHLTEEQREAWKSLLPRGVSDEGDTLEERWEKLKQAPPAKLAQMLSRLEPASALEVDLAKEILAGLPLNGGAQNGGIRALQDIITAEAKYPRVKLSELCDFRKGTFPTQATPPGPYPMVVTAQERKTSDRFDFEGPAVCIPLISSSGHGKASMIRIHYQEGQFACANLLFGLLAKQPGELDMKYLYHILSQRLERLFCPLMKGTANVSMRMEDAVQVEFPLPPLEEQQRLVAEIERLRAIVESAESFAANWRIEPIADGSQYERVPLGSLIEESLYGTSEKAEYRDTGVPVLRICNIAFCDFALDDLKRLDLPEYDLLKYKLQSDDFLIVRSNGNPALVGKCAVWPGGEENYVYASYLIRFRFKKDLVNPRYVMFFLMSDEGRSLLSPQQGGGTYNISATSFQAVPIPLPPLKIQNSLVEEWSEAFSTVQKVKALSSRANKKILDFLTRIWES